MKTHIKALILPIFLLLLFSCKHDVDVTPSKTQQDVYDIDKYLSTNKTNYIGYHTSGIRLVLSNLTANNTAHSGQTVKLKYTERLFTDPNKVTATGTYEGLVEKLFTQGLIVAALSLPEGSAATVYVPSELGYGTKGTTDISPNSILIYDVELISITKTASELTQFKADTAAIHQYLISKNITNAMEDPTGIWYTVDSAASGAIPRLYDKVTASYSGSLLSNGLVFDKGDLINQRIYTLIDGLKIGIPKMNTESVVTFYIPSGLAYGPSSSGAIPANAILVFTIKLRSTTAN